MSVFIASAPLSCTTCSWLSRSKKWREIRITPESVAANVCVCVWGGITKRLKQLNIERVAETKKATKNRQHSFVPRICESENGTRCCGLRILNPQVKQPDSCVTPTNKLTHNDAHSIMLLHVSQICRRNQQPQAANSICSRFPFTKQQRYRGAKNNLGPMGDPATR